MTAVVEAYAVKARGLGDAGKPMREPVRVERATVAAFAYEVEIGPPGT
jgi:hypothetical protein